MELKYEQIPQSVAEAAWKKWGSEILRTRGELVDKMILHRVLGVRCCLVEDRSDPNKTIWKLHIEGEEDPF